MNVELIGCEPSGGPLEIVIGPGTAPSLEVKGYKERALVSASGPVCRGEFVRRVAEYAAAGEELRWGLGDVHVLDAAELSRGRVGVVFAQNGATKFKILSLVDGALALGNTLILVEDEAMEAARVIELPDDRAMMIYNRDAAGMAAVIALDGRTASLAYTDIWDDRDPENLCACRMDGDRVVLSGMRQSPGEMGEAWVILATVGADRLTLGTAVRVDGGNDVDVYAGGWSLCRASPSSAVLCFPQALDKPIGFAVLDVDLSDDTGRGLIVRCVGYGKYAASLPSIAAVGLEGGRWAMAYGVGWLSPDKKVLKSTLALEVWGLTRYAVELMWYGCEDTRYDTSIGAVGMEPNGVGLVCSYTGDNEGRCILLGMLEGPSPGPAVSAGVHNGFCRVIPISVQKALLVTQRSGNGYVCVMEAVERVVPTDVMAHGLALSGGGPGEEITAAMMQ